MVALSTGKGASDLGSQDAGAGGLAQNALQEGAGFASVDYVGRRHGGHGVKAGLELGNHAAPGDVGLDQHTGPAGVHQGQAPAGRVEDTFYVGEEDKIGGGEFLGQAAGNGVAVDVEKLIVVLVEANGGYEGHEASVEDAGDGFGVHLGYLADEAEFGVGNAAPEETPVNATEAYDAGTEGGEGGHKLLVDEAGKYGGNDVETGAVGHPKAADESGHGAVAFHPLGDNFAAAMDDDYAATFLLKARQVLQSGVVAAEGAAANLDHDGGFRRAVGVGRGYVHCRVLGGVGAVEGDVLFAEVATPGGGAVLAQVQIDPDFHLSLGHESYDGVPVEGSGEAVFHDKCSVDV